MTIEQQVSEETPEPGEVRRALDSVVASEALRDSPQLATFLRFVVEAVLRGESSRIKGYTIGVEAFGRPANFDPQIDPIVRVEATRLRRALERHYAGPGAADPIRFDLTRGSYVPAIRRAVQTTGDTGAGTEFAAWRRIPKKRIWQITLVASIAILVIASAAALMLSRSADRAGPKAVATRGPASQTFEGPLQPGNGMPTLEIPRVVLMNVAQAAAERRPPALPAIPLTDKLRAAFARFDTINVANPPADGSDERIAAPDYRLVGSGEFQEDGTVKGRFQLLDVGEGTVVWSADFGPVPPVLDYGPAEDAIVKQVVTTLAPPFGVIRAHERAKHLAKGTGDPRYRCIVETSESFRSFSPEQHTRARACLESLTARDPGFAMGFAYLAAVYAREYQYGMGAAQPDAALLDRALAAARQAVELSPESARAYQMLFTVLFARHQTAAAFAAGDKALALNPYDITIQNDYGGRLILDGEVERGMQMLLRAADDNAVRPSWYHFYLFLAHYLKNDMAGAARHASLITSDNFPLGLLARALIAAADGDRELARKTYDQLATLRPGWRTAPREELFRLFPTPIVVDRLARDLGNAGLAPSR